VAAGGGRKGSRPVMGRKPSELIAFRGQRRKRKRNNLGPKGIGLHIENRNSLCNTFSADLT
jgi:hypothetical protein